MKTRYEAALDWLYEQKKSQKRKDLFRIKECIKLLNIQINYPVFHIAGTNGKGSTASFLQQMLLLKGEKVGMFVSPYVISFNERIEINGKYITDEEVIFYIDKLKEFSKKYQEDYKDTIPFFELTFLMALLYFQDKRIDILVLECGLGGLLDVTNAIEKKAAIITNIGFDHMAQLGNSLEEIATHKLGITRPNVPCFTTVDEQMIPYFSKYAQNNHIPMYFIQPEISHIIMMKDGTEFNYNRRIYHTSLRGLYQAYNAGLAIAVIKHFYPDYKEELIDQALKTTAWPGRFELIQENILLDGAHNLPGVEALCRSLKDFYSKKKIKIVFTALKDKASKDMLKVLDEVAIQYYFTTILDKRASNIEEFVLYTQRPYEIFNDYKDAIHKAVLHLKKDELLVITGSLHFISEVRRIWMEVKDNAV